MPGALDGITVVDLSWGMAGPMASGQLADQGADVLRVEPPGGDPYRRYVSHAAYDRSKRSMVVDLATPDGIAVVHRLIEGADVVIESWQPGTAETLGLGHGALLSRFPGLVYCSISGYGAQSRIRDRPGYDSLVSARLGTMAEHQGDDDQPVYLGVPIASLGAALLAVIGITAALLEREGTGKGQWVETSLVDGSLAFMSMFWERLENLPDAAPGVPPMLSTYRLLVNNFRCADGEFLGIHTGANGSHARLMEALGLSDRIAPAIGGREKMLPLSEAEAEIIGAEVPAIFASRPRSHWLEVLRANDVTAIPILRQTEALVQEQTCHNDTPLQLDDPELGPIGQVGIAARLAATPGEVRGPAPKPGHDTDEVLRQIGYSDEEVVRLRRAAAVS